MSGFRFHLDSVHKPSAWIKLTSDPTRFKMSSILLTLPHTTSWFITRMTTVDCGTNFSVHFSHTVVFNDCRSKRSFSHNAHVLDLYLAENMFSNNSSVYNNYFQKSFIFSEIRVSIAKNAVSWAQRSLSPMLSGKVKNFTARFQLIPQVRNVLCCLYFQPILRLILLGTFAQFRKATISFVMFNCPSVLMEQLNSHWKDIH
jgi:hypothetical protein